jgi:hypothetical protein
MNMRRTASHALILYVVAALACPAFGGEIHDAAKSGNVETVKALLKDNPNLVSSKDSYGAVPLHWAALNGHEDVAKLLLANNAAIDVRESNGQTPLHLAVFNHYNDVVQLLLVNKADVNAKSNNGTTPLSLATNKGYRDVVAVLLANKADVNAGWPLIAATQQDYKDLVELLLANKASVNAKEDKDGDTALHYAVLGGFNDVVEVLLANKADINAKNNRGKTPLDYAQTTGKGLPELLRQHGGPPGPASVRVAQATATGSKPGPVSASSSPVRAMPPTTAQTTASTSRANTRLVSELPFAVKGLVLPPGASIKTDADEYIKEAAGLRIEALYVGGTEVPLKSGTLSPNMLIPTRDYGDVQLKFSLGGGPLFCQILGSGSI